MKQLTVIFCALIILLLSVIQPSAKTRTEEEGFATKEITAPSFHHDVSHIPVHNDFVAPDALLEVQAIYASLNGVNYLQKILFTFIRTKAP